MWEKKQLPVLYTHARDLYVVSTHTNSAGGSAIGLHLGLFLNLIHNCRYATYCFFRYEFGIYAANNMKECSSPVSIPAELLIANILRITQTYAVKGSLIAWLIHSPQTLTASFSLSGKRAEYQPRSTGRRGKAQSLSIHKSHSVPYITVDSIESL